VPIDPRIPLLAERPRIISPADMVSLQAISTQQKRGALALEAEQRDFEEQQAVRQLLSQPGAIEPETGTPTPQAITSLYSVAPKYAQASQQQRQQAYLRLDQMRQANIQEQVNLGLLSDKQAARYRQAHSGETGAWLSAYEAKIASGASESEALRAAEEAFSTQIQMDFDSGLLSGVPEEGIQKVLGEKRDVYSMRAKMAGLAPAEVRAEKQVAVQQKQAETAEQRAETDAERAARQEKTDSARLALEREKLAFEKTKAEKGPPQKALPITAAQKLLENQQNLNKARDALKLIESVKGATGVKGFLPDFILQRTDPKGVEARAAVADLGSMIIHDRSGAAVTAAEFPRLRPFIPLMTDDQETVVKKLKRFMEIYQEVTEDAAEFYKDSGYKVPELKSNEPPTKTTPKAIKNPLPPGWKIEKVQ